MQIRFSRQGGFTGRPLTFDLDTGALTAGEAAVVTRLVEQARAAVPVHVAPRTRDGFSYRVEVVDGGKTTTLQGADGAMSDELAALVAELTRLQKTRRGGRG
jgi:Emfourin